MDGWMGGCKSRFKDCLQQSKMYISVDYAVIQNFDHKVIERHNSREKVRSYNIGP
jgi:hypothetical protein